MPTYTTKYNLEKPEAGETDRQQDVGANLDLIDAALPQTGMMYPFPGSVLPSGGYAWCDGGSMSKLDGANLPLFNVIGYTYGGSGNSFNVPDTRGRVIAGLNTGDANFSPLGKSGGEATHVLTPDETPIKATGSESIGFGLTKVLSFLNRVLVSGRTATAHNNLQPYLVTNWIIKL